MRKEGRKEERRKEGRKEGTYAGRAQVTRIQLALPLSHSCAPVPAACSAASPVLRPSADLRASRACHSAGKWPAAPPAPAWLPEGRRASRLHCGGQSLAGLHTAQQTPAAHLRAPAASGLTSGQHSQHGLLLLRQGSQPGLLLLRRPGQRLHQRLLQLLQQRLPCRRGCPHW